MLSPLHRLASALAGRGPVDPLQSPPEGQKPFPATPVPPLAVKAPQARPSAVPGHARLVTHAGQTQSIRAWAMNLGLDRRTLAYRLNHGWSVDQALSFTPRPRDHAAEQAASAERLSRVLVVDGTRIVPRAEVAARLGVKTRSLTHRLRQYRHPDGTTSTKVPLEFLLDRSWRQSLKKLVANDTNQ